MNPDDLARVYHNEQEAHYELLRAFVDAKKGANRLDGVTMATWDTLIELGCALGKDFVKDAQLSGGRFNHEHLLLVFSAAQSLVGLNVVYAAMGMFQELVKINGGGDLVEVCRRYGSRDPNIWRLAMAKLLEKREVNAFVELVKVMAEEMAMPLLVALEVCRGHSWVTLAHLKPLAAREFALRQAAVAKIEGEGSALTELNLARDGQLVRLQTKAFTAKGMKCETCRKPLDLPAKYFLCGHSFHLACLGDDLSKCARCKEEQERIVRMMLAGLEDGHALCAPTSDERYPFEVMTRVSDRYSSNMDVSPFQRWAAVLAGQAMTVDPEGKVRQEAEDLHREYVRHG